jgi:cytochrome oxidase Cu insertion factor (SCO1/SenC/PrrC family)
MALNKTAGRMKVAFAFLLLFGPALFLILISTRGCDHKFKELDDYGRATAYSFTGINGKTYTANDFKDEIVLITTLQESCPDDCAVSMWHVNQLIYQHIRKNKSKKMKKIRIISFVTDGKGNPLKDLTTVSRILKDRVEAYDPEIWTLASGDARSIYDFEHNGEKLLKEGEEYYGGHSYQELMLLLDKQNHLRMVLSGRSEGMIRRMKEHIALLQKQYDKQAFRKKHAQN